MAQLRHLRSLIKALLGPLGRHIYCEIKNAFARPQFASIGIDYEEYWKRREFIAVQPRYPVMFDLIPQGASLLDIGCGDGGFLAYVKGRKVVNELGIDISQTAVDLCRARGLRARLCHVPALVDECRITNKRFDVVVISEVIEHVSEPEDLLRAAWQLTERSMVISFPNIAFWPHRLRLLFGRNPIQWVYFQGEHLRFWSVSDFIEWLQVLDLPDAKVSRNIIGTTGTTTWGLHRRFPNFFGNQIVVTLERRSSGVKE